MKQQPWIFRKENGRLVPAEPWTAERMDALPVNKDLKSDRIVLPRSRPFQGMYWATLSQIIKATGMAPDAEALHKALLKLTRRVTPVRDLQGNVIELVPDSTSFEKMDQVKFSQYVTEAQYELSKLGVVWEDYRKEVA